MAMTTRRRLARDGLLYGGGLALQRGLSFLVLPAATRILGPEEFGIATAALVIAGVLSNIFTLGISFAIVRLYFDEPEDAERTQWATLLRAQLLLGAALAGIAWLLGPSWSHIYVGVPWGGALQAAVVLALAQASQATSLGVLRAARRVYAFAAVVVVQVVLGAALAIALADSDGAAGLVIGLAIGAGVSALLGAVLTYRRPAWSWPALRAGLILSIPFLGHMLASWVLSLSDRVLIERYLGLGQLGAYQVAYALALVPILITDAVQTAWLPHYYALRGPTKRSLPARLALRVTVAVAAVAAIVVLLAPSVSRLLAPSTFHFPTLVVPLVVSATFVRASYLLAFAVLSDAKQSHAIAAASSLGAVLNVVLNLWLIQEWGLTGAAATTLVAYGVMSLVALLRAERVVGESLHIGRLVQVWLVAVGAMLLLSTLPTDTLGWTARGLLALAVAIAATVAVVRARIGHAAVMSTT